MKQSRPAPPTILYEGCKHVLKDGKDARPRDPLGVLPLAEAPADAPYQLHDWHGRPVRRLTMPRVDLVLQERCPWCRKLDAWR